MKDEATKLYLLLNQEKLSLKLPHISDFPRGACEVCSILLAIIYLRKGFKESLSIIEGYNHEEDLWHFWVRFDEVLIDITVEQFDYSVFTNFENYLDDMYPIQKVYDPKSFLRINSLFSLYSEAFVDLAFRV